VLVSQSSRAELEAVYGRLNKEIAEREHVIRELADQKYALDQHAIVAITDVQGTITQVNERFCTISKYSRDELIGQNHRILNSGHHPKEFFHAMYQTIANGRVWHGEIKNRAKDGSFYWVDTTIVPFIGENGKPWQYIAIRADITERKRVTEELARKMTELHRSNQELEQFAYVASHDLQEPLRMVAAYTQLLAEKYRGKLDEQADKYIAYAVDGATRMQGLIQDLLRFSRVGRAEPNLQNTDSYRVVELARAQLFAAIKESGAVIELGPLPQIVADGSQLVQVFQNLISNAIKFHGEKKPVVRIDAEKQGDEWRFTIADNGIGVIFKRLHTRTEYPGNGIGLSICKKIVERHGGRIWAESVPGEGSKFIFTLPSLPLPRQEARMVGEEMR